MVDAQCQPRPGDAGGANDRRAVDAPAAAERHGRQAAHVPAHCAAKAGTVGVAEAWIVVIARQIADIELAAGATGEIEQAAEAQLPAIGTALKTIAVAFQIVVDFIDAPFGIDDEIR